MIKRSRGAQDDPECPEVSNLRHLSVGAATSASGKCCSFAFRKPGNSQIPERACSSQSSGWSLHLFSEWTSKEQSRAHNEGATGTPSRPGRFHGPVTPRLAGQQWISAVFPCIHHIWRLLWFSYFILPTLKWGRIDFNLASFFSELQKKTLYMTIFKIQVPYTCKTSRFLFFLLLHFVWSNQAEPMASSLMID